LTIFAQIRMVESRHNEVLLWHMSGKLQGGFTETMVGYRYANMQV